MKTWTVEDLRETMWEVGVFDKATNSHYYRCADEPRLTSTIYNNKDGTFITSEVDGKEIFNVPDNSEPNDERLQRVADALNKEYKK